MDSSPISLLLFLLLLPLPISSKNIFFDFPSFSLRNLTLLGPSSFLRGGSLFLSAGAAVFSVPIQFSDQRTGLSASFSTAFSFSIPGPGPASNSFADGLAFFLSHDAETLSTPAAYLGLFGSTKNFSIIALEFDARVNRIGLDVGGAKSLIKEDLDPHGIELRSGNLIMAWIEYETRDQSLNVSMGYSSLKPERPVLSTRFDLGRHFEEYMFVGFSTPPRGSAEAIMIESWSFRTSGLPSLDLSRRAPHTVSDSFRRLISAKSSSTPARNSRKKLIIGFGVVGPAAVSVVFVVFVCMSIKRRMKIRADKESFKADITKGPRQFRYQELFSATKGFHSSRIIGRGGFGVVYKAVYPEAGISYAVKRSKSQESKSEFIAELSIIADLKHQNLVQLQGWCTEKNELLLVYEFMPNGSLDKVLYPCPDSRAWPVLDWTQRYNIVTGIASVLHYLHQGCEQKVIHRDIKSSNIMLDAEFNPKLGDFGLARSMEHNESPKSTLPAGTVGYLAPEYLHYGKATEKSDVFSYGIVVLEICTGRRSINTKGGESSKNANLADWVWNLYSEDKLAEAVDPRLNGEFDRDQMMRLLLMGLSCVNPGAAERPDMRRIVQILECKAEPLAVPRTKPLLTFNSTIPISLEEIVSDGHHNSAASNQF
ncbi:probable L-type lectin-domain containing receptor kinase S.7 [Typha angustifolia]|uniref:probable L-type lectin-domain containing receptor kinase S.7 n=1 Tax=Typha angustifolia TaxID=59011 RepID=UPI003C2B5BA8